MENNFKEAIMSYIKVGFELAVGWYFGKTMCHIVDEASARLVRHYVPEKYWNARHPDYPLRTNIKANKQAKMKIGFSTE